MVGARAQIVAQGIGAFHAQIVDGAIGQHFIKLDVKGHGCIAGNGKAQHACHVVGKTVSGVGIGVQLLPAPLI